MTDYDLLQVIRNTLYIKQEASNEDVLKILFDRLLRAERSEGELKALQELCYSKWVVPTKANIP